MATRNSRRIYHENDPYAKGNDITGDRIAAILGRWIDHDVQFALFRVMIVTHWGNAKRERWMRPNGKRETRNFSLIPLAQVLRLTCQGIYKIRRPRQVMIDAERLGVPGIEFEFKKVPSLFQMRRLARDAKAIFGPNWQKRVEVKMLAGFSWRTTLRRAKRAGFRTTLIGFTGNPAYLPKYVDTYRPAR